MSDPAHLPWPIPTSLWHPHVLAWLDRHETILWGVAISGGSDSVALAASVAAEAVRRGKRVLALHFNHRLRGAESDVDEQWVRNWCDSEGMPLDVGAWDFASPKASEGEAREARLAFFNRSLSSHPGAVLFTGHHADDAVETMLLRLSRGAGASGLAAPRPVHVHGGQPTRLRPFLQLPKQAIGLSLKRAGRSWREDSTNAADTAVRNRLRHHVVNEWMQVADRDVRQGVLRSRSLLEEDDSALETVTTRLLKDVDLTLPELKLHALEGSPRAIYRRALRRWTHSAGLSAEGFERLLEVCMAGQGSVSLARGVAEVSGGKIVVQMPAEPANRLPARLGVGDVVQWHDGDIGYETVSATPLILSRILSGSINPSDEAWLSDVPRAVTVRQWEAGDRYGPLGLGGTAKLQDLFVNSRVPVEKRRRIPVVCLPTGEIIWVPGFPPAETVRVHESCRTLGHLTYRAGTFTLVDQSP
ncbi:MAG: tRNA lysidine(34) synthetase TilS [Opitutaceae bacterium]|nr:tRNA lysidine(34) synthetase TilS [Opitutaceae bacterium]